MGGTFHLRLNTNSSPIANKYREGKVQSTLERELNVPETAVMQAYGTCAWSWDWVCPVVWCSWSGASVSGCGYYLRRWRASHPAAFANTGSRAVKSPSSFHLRVESGDADCVRTVKCGRALSLPVCTGSTGHPAGRLVFVKVLRVAGALCCVGLQGVIRPVLKHGPRSPYTCASM